MNDDADEPATAEDADFDELTALLDELDDLARSLPATARTSFELLLRPEKISHATGVAPERVSALLDGADPERDNSRAAAQKRIVRRLRFLRQTRLKPPATRRRKAREYFLSEIARGAQGHGAQISKQTVHYIFENEQMTSPENIAGIERFFGVRPGFCTLTESEALAGYLAPVVQQLKILLWAVGAAGEHGVTEVAARSTRDLSRDTDALTDILTAVVATHRRQSPGTGGRSGPGGASRSEDAP
ncbi:hypothetical protein QQM39_31395 [Streptomyces sp. DT2A-34]|uniref:hypothetical protein n=1 Tax=Streptomyces sp. DT2A-34 TaxID=3051182 RepID=UPI00265BE5F3|nr:hypothetical protein [Streptomyces sp. DT2A-34]MDO0915164.1 hypothetical protein [Streptomyces sp. DT2A-34]